jgi:NTP pyrophosphatase (non-canonical NTP hydrolase)
MDDWKELQNALLKFRDERNWEQFRNPKDLALALSIEAAELNELFLWKRPEDANKDKIKEELADVLAY